ncbi:MAG: hypothetical protein ACI4JT_01990 [Oscillospiraceae bacterium]
MNFVGILKAAREAEMEITAELEQIERLHRIMRNTGHSLAYAQSLAENLAKFEEELNANIDRAVDAKREALTVLSVLHGDERTILYQYYILAKDWRKISDEMYISERQVFNLRKKALDSLNRHYKCAKQTVCEVTL